jgi:hypothetical protein
MGFATGVNLNGATDTTQGAAGSTESYKGGFKMNNAKLETATTQSSDYRAWPASMPERRQAAKYQAQPGSFDGTTTNKSDYAPKELTTERIRKTAQYQKSPHKMESITTQNESYRWTLSDAQVQAQRYRMVQTPRRGGASVLNIGERG